jgi:hypothetical protein
LLLQVAARFFEVLFGSVRLLGYETGPQSLTRPNSIGHSRAARGDSIDPTVIAPSIGWYQTFVFNTLMGFRAVTDIRSMMTLAEIKSTTSIPLRNRSK